MILDPNLSTEAIDSFPSVQPADEPISEEKQHDLFAPSITNQDDFERAVDRWHALPDGQERNAYESAVIQYHEISMSRGEDPWIPRKKKRFDKNSDKATYSALNLDDPAIEQEAKEVIGEEEVKYLKSMPESLRKDFAVGRATKIMFGDDSYDSRAMLGEKMGVPNGDTDSIFNKLRESGDKRRELTIKIRGERKQVREMAFSNLESDGELTIDYLHSKGLGSAEAITYWRELKPSFDKARSFMLAWGDEARQTKYAGAWEQDKVIASLTSLRAENPQAYELIMDGTMAVMKGEQKGNLPFLSAFSGALLKAGRGLRGATELVLAPQNMYTSEGVLAYSVPGREFKIYSQQENITLRDLRSVCDLSWEPPEDAGAIRKFVDGTGSAMGQTVAFMATNGWSSLAYAEEAYVDSRADGDSFHKSLVYGGIKGVVNNRIERLGLGSFAKVRRFGIGTPFGKVNNAVGSWANKGGLASQYGKKTGINFAAEMGENFATPIVEYGAGNPLSYALGAGQHMTLNEAMNEFGHAFDLKSGSEMLAVSSIFGGVTSTFSANDRRVFMRELSPERRDAVLKICESPAILEQMGAKPKEIKTLMSTANPDKQIAKFYDLDLPSRQQAQKATQEGGSLDVVGRESFAKQEGNESVAATQGTLGSVDDVVVIPAEFALPQELMAAGEIDTFKKLDDGNWEVTNRKTEEKTLLDDDQAKSLLNAQLTQARGEDAIHDAFVKENEVATVNLVEHFQDKDGSIQFEKLNEPQTIARLEAQSKLASDKIAKLNLEGNKNAEMVIDPEIDGELTLGAVRDMPGEFSKRIDQENEMNGNTALSPDNAATNAYNLTREDGTAIIRWVEKGATPLNIIEEGNEIFLKRDIANRGSNQWHTDNLRAFQATEEYGKLGMGELIPTEGEVDDSRVIEAMSRVMRAVLTNKIDETKLPEQSKRFIAWVRRVLSSIMSLAKLGAAYESAAKAGKIDANWQNWVYESAGITGETWRQERENAGKELVAEANEAVNFSIFSPSEAEGIHALQSITRGAKEARFRSDTLNHDVILELGSAGDMKQSGKVVNYYGLEHLVTMRMAHGESLDEASYTAVKSILAAVNGAERESIGTDRKKLYLDEYNAAISLTWNGKEGAWMISGFKDGDRNSNADDRKRALHLASSYAPDSFVSRKEVGAALDYAIARVAREYKENVGKNTVSNSVNFSLVGEGAANWKKIKHNAFEGIHDGKPRVELDASKAAVKMHKSGVDMVTYYESSIKRDRKADNSKYLNTLGRILEFDELYKSYPWLSDVHVRGIRDKSQTQYAAVGNYGDGDVGDITLNFANSRGDNPFQSEAFNGDSKRFLLHEIQHIIQLEEGFEYGWSKDYWERPGELESRNVERRSEFSEETRNIHPFNKTFDLDVNFSTQGDEIKAQTQRFIASGQAAQARFWEATSKRINKEIDRVEKLLSGETTSREEYLLAVNRATGVVQTAASMLPPGYRFPIEHYVTRLGLLAEMASTGEINVSRRLNESARREYLRESVKDLGDQIESLREQARADLEEAQTEILANKKGELNEKIEAKYRALDYQERAVAKGIYNKRNKEIIAIRKRFKNPDVISGKISRANTRLDESLSKLETRQEKLEKAISKLEGRKASLKAKGIKERDIFSASEEDISEIRKAWAEGKANELIKTFLERINSKVNEFTKDSYKDAMSKIIASVMPKKTKTGAPQKSRALDADATRTVLSIAESMGLKEEALNGRLAAIELESESANNDATLTNEARRIKLADLEASEIRLKTFGCVDGMDSADMAIALNELVKFVGSGRESWSNKIEDRLARLDEIADRIMKELPEASDADLQKARSARSEGENGKTERGEKAPIGKFFTGLYNFPNFLESLSSLKPLKEEYQQRMVDEQNRITDKTIALQRRMNSAIVGITGKKKIREVTAWLGNNKIVKDTGITYVTRSMVKGQLTVEDAKRLIDSDFKGSDKTINERAAIRDDWKDYEAKGMRANRKYISYTFEESQKTEKLFVSKFQALNMLLWADQDSYKINAFEQGYTKDVIKQMKDYVGKEVIAFGEYLKEECRTHGKDAAKVFEALLGIPFPMHDNYFPGRHLKLDQMSDRDALQTLSGGLAMGKGGANAFIKSRRQHHEKVDQSVDAACSYLQHAAAVIQWTETQETVSELKYILKRKDVSQRIIASIGKDRYDTMLKWIDKHELGGVEQAKSIESSDSMARACYEPLVYALLGGNIGTVIRNAEGILNAPASMHVGSGEWMTSAVNVISGKSAQTIAQLWKNPTFQRRMNGMRDGKFGAYVTSLAAGTKSGTTFAQLMQYVNAGLVPMEYADAGGNVLTYAIGYDATYRAERKTLENINSQREEADRLPEGEIDKLAHKSAQSALDLGVAKGAQGMSNLTKPFDMGNHGFGRLFVMFSSDAVKSSMQTASLWKSGRKGKAVTQWLLRGLINQMIAYGIDWLSNDENPPEWEDYIAGIALGAWNGIALLGGLGEAINMLTAEFGWTNKVKFGGAGRLIFDPVGATKSISKVVKMATDDKDDSWIDYTKGSFNAVKSGAIAGGTVLKATAKGGKVAEQAFAGLMAAAGASNVAKFGVNVADKLDLQDSAKDIKEAKAKHRRESKEARED